MSDHLHAWISIPPQYAVSRAGGRRKGNGAIHLARVERKAAELAEWAEA